MDEHQMSDQDLKEKLSAAQAKIAELEAEIKKWKN